MSDVIAQFRDAMMATGIAPPDQIIGDGKRHRFSTNGKRSDDSGFYQLYMDGLPAGYFGCWRAGVLETWRADIGRELTPEERRENARRLEALQRERRAEQERRHASAAKRACGLWNGGNMAISHQYLIKKRVTAYGLRLHAEPNQDLLMIPVRDVHRTLTSLQFVAITGKKKFLTGGQVAGGYHLIGEPAGMLCIAEGYATGATIHEATHQAVAIAFNAGNLGAVATALRRKHPDIRLLICADNDHQTEGNPGVTYAEEAAQAANALVAIPECEGTDFNDLMIERGQDAVRHALRAAMRRPAA